MYENGESTVSGSGESIFNPSNFSIGLELQHELSLDVAHLSDSQFIQGVGHDLNKALPYDDQQNWENQITYTFSTQNPNLDQDGNLHYIDMQNGHHSNFNVSSLPDLMSLYPPSLLAKPSFDPFVNQPIVPQNFSVTNRLLESNVVYDSRDFHQSLGQQWEYEIGEEINKVDYKGKGVTKAKEKFRRELVNDKYTALRNLLPNSIKTDKASIIADAINYIKELVMTKNELNIQVEKKRNARERNKRRKTAQDTEDVNELADESMPLRRSWVQRKSKETEVDVRIVDDEAIIKLAHKKRTNFLLIVSKMLDELKLDIHHVAGGLVGDNFSFLFNTKIREGSCVFASAIANKIIEVADGQYAEI